MKRASTLLSFSFLLMLFASSPAAAQNYTVTASPATVNPGGTITVQWTAPSGTAYYDWIGLYEVGASNYSYRWWAYTYGATSGTAYITAPAQAGNYEVRYLLNNGYTDAARSNPVSVESGYTVTATPANAVVGQSLTVSWTAPAGAGTWDWIGLFKVGTSNYSYLWYRYTYGATSGSFSVAGPTQPGDYELRYLLNNGYTSVAKSGNIRVDAEGAGNYGLEASPTTVAAGETVRVSWTAPAGRPWTDWIGLYEEGSSNYYYLWWSYTNGQTSGSFNVRMPSTPGKYEFRYLLNNGYTHTARSQTITVGEAAGSYSVTPSVTTVTAGGALSVSWTAPTGRPYSDWIGLFRTGDSNYQYGWWIYTAGAASGTANLTAPSTPGAYEFRYLLNNGYTDVVRSVTVTVSSP